MAKRMRRSLCPPGGGILSQSPTETLTSKRYNTCFVTFLLKWILFVTLTTCRQVAEAAFSVLCLFIVADVAPVRPWNMDPLPGKSQTFAFARSQTISSLSLIAPCSSSFYLFIAPPFTPVRPRSPSAVPPRLERITPLLVLILHHKTALLINFTCRSSHQLNCGGVKIILSAKSKVEERLSAVRTQ